VGLSAPLAPFSLAETLGLTARARHPGPLRVEGPDGHGTLYVTAGRFSAGEAADYSGPVDDRHALDVRLIDVCFHLMRFEGGSFEFVVGEQAPWTAERATDIAPIVETVEHIVRAWPAVEAVLPSFDVRPELADDLPEDSLTLSRTGFRVFTLIDGQRTVRQIARELESSIVEVGPVVRDLIEHGAVRIPTGARPEPEPAANDLILPTGAVHVALDAEADEGRGSIEMVTSVPDPNAALDAAAIERERAALAARAGLDDPGPVPTEPGEAVGGGVEGEEDETTSEITSDRGALLRLFSGLRDQG
jgi:hypothetical protein